jgi:hypothetical protein
MFLNLNYKDDTLKLMFFSKVYILELVFLISFGIIQTKSIYCILDSEK